MKLFNQRSSHRQLRVRPRIHALIIYDLSDDKRRLELAKLLQGFGRRVQYSGFEVMLDRATYSRMMRLIMLTIEPEDNVRIYRVHSAGDVSILGRGDPYIDEEIVVL